jgi:hypothetical protein
MIRFGLIGVVIGAMSTPIAKLHLKMICSMISRHRSELQILKKKIYSKRFSK